MIYDRKLLRTPKTRWKLFPHLTDKVRSEQRGSESFPASGARNRIIEIEFRQVSSRGLN